MKSHNNFKFNQISEDTFEILLLNNWTKDTLSQNIEEINQLKLTNNMKIFLDFSNLDECDSASFIYIISLTRKFIENTVVVKNLQKFESKYRFYEKNYQENRLSKKEQNTFTKKFVKILEQKVSNYFSSFVDFTQFLGKLFFFFIYSLINPKKIRLKAMFQYIETSAINALFIVGTTSFLVGVVIAYQGAVQLEKFGANIFIVEMITITMFREIAPLVTAIVIAGRTASAFTAEIGAMKITDEIDAMRTMDFEPTLFLTLPRIFALVISLPLLVFFADVIGILGGMLIANIDLNVSFMDFIHRIESEVALKHFLIGIIKAVFFGIAIAVIGCYRGFQVQNNTTSIGKYTTLSVVNAIFSVIALNAIFSVIFTEIGI
ncbi:MlaE family lipid ABC transporter permease subunit [Arcobacter sp. 15-2]|uniref:MlaE family ABC transporter permease n=1 Tax=Arcobacter sp. 15-2 TaxID=3374109 RepID=UPI00399CE092